MCPGKLTVYFLASGNLFHPAQNQTFTEFSCYMDQIQWFHIENIVVRNSQSDKKQQPAMAMGASCGQQYEMYTTVNTVHQCCLSTDQYNQAPYC